ncbi:MAG TPA: AIR synthase-related protein [Solirubrobacteraceae bacterium]|nr:AIR synthase-related protein [Solirubrobacteraceae bacterium]
MSEPSAYRTAGVDYETLDAGKRDALGQALTTSELLLGHGARARDESRGEPAFVFELGGRAFALVLECLGTKSVVAREAEGLLGPAGFDAVAYDTVAAVVNDLCCVGALPLVVNAYFATGASEWYGQRGRHEALLAGWRAACEDAGATWGGGESPTLAGLVAAEDIELAGCAVGAVPEGHRPVLGDALEPGDEIVFVASSGLHANGASLARRIAAQLPEGYGARLPSGRGFGEAVLDRSVIYVGLVRRLLQEAVPVHYLSHITGHGLLKLMRPRRELGYRVNRLPEVPEVLSFLVERAAMAPRAAYCTFNMGVGMAVYCAGGSGERVVELAAAAGLRAHVAGEVTEGPRRVELPEIGVVLEGAELDFSPGG